MSYRNLTHTEISDLKNQGCTASSWENIFVKNGFSVNNICNTRFEGNIKLGAFNQNIELEKGISKPAGLKTSYIKDCEIGDNPYISNVGSLINYRVEDQVIIENVGTVAVTEESTFGNGIEIAVLNEAGGRELPVFDQLSAQIAYLIVFYRHDKVLIEKLSAIIDVYVENKKSAKGIIGKKSRIANTSSVRNVAIGSYATISGASNLENGTIASCRKAPTKIGANVSARDFIILTGSEIDTGAIIVSSFIGQGVRIGKQFSAENCAFFSNCEGFHGEAVSVLAGPYTVTHHKSTLLIAGMFSFFNAGSGSNQSNHMYKLGPVHQGIVERGSKTGSFSYMLWPCRVGAYSVVMDKHSGNFDTSKLPFSYITIENGRSVITPAMNLFTVGTSRDIVKWPKRDRRTDPEKLDIINYEFLNPYIVGRIINGIKLLKELHDSTSKKQEYVMHKGININRLMLNTSRRYYEIAVHVYIGNLIIDKLTKVSEFSSIEDIQNTFKSPSDIVNVKWVDMLGMVCSENLLNSFISSVKSGEIFSVEGLHKKLKSIQNNYETGNFEWGIKLAQEYLQIDFAHISKNDLINIVTEWKTNSLKMNNMIRKDAEKEFDQNSRMGFGIDGDDKVIQDDFDAIRGTFETNPFVETLNRKSLEIEAKYNLIISQLEKL